MFSKAAVVISALAASANAARPILPPPGPYGPPAPIHPLPIVHKPLAPAHGYAEPPKPYAFEYGVHDDYSGASFDQKETSDTNIVAGQYKVALPDGRIQIVDYTADVGGYGGYVADVKYDGVAHPPPAYKPAPHPAPIHPVPVVAPIHPARPLHPALPLHG